MDGVGDAKTFFNSAPLSEQGRFTRRFRAGSLGVTLDDPAHQPLDGLCHLLVTGASVSFAHRERIRYLDLTVVGEKPEEVALFPG
jgi:hypothetical protein